MFSQSGVLFLDELPEFQRGVLDALRQPMEERRVNLSRISGNVTYPSDFMLVAAMKADLLSIIQQTFGGSSL